MADGGGDSLAFGGRTALPLGSAEPLPERVWDEDGEDAGGGGWSGSVDRRCVVGRLRGADTLVLGFDDDEDPVAAAVLDSLGCRELAPEIAAVVEVLVRPNCGTQRGR